MVLSLNGQLSARVSNIIGYLNCTFKISSFLTLATSRQPIRCFKSVSKLYERRQLSGVFF